MPISISSVEAVGNVVHAFYLRTISAVAKDSAISNPTCHQAWQQANTHGKALVP